MAVECTFYTSIMVRFTMYYTGTILQLLYFADMHHT